MIKIKNQSEIAKTENIVLSKKSSRYKAEAITFFILGLLLILGATAVALEVGTNLFGALYAVSILSVSRRWSRLPLSDERAAGQG